MNNIENNEIVVDNNVNASTSVVQADMGELTLSKFSPEDQTEIVEFSKKITFDKDSRVALTAYGSETLDKISEFAENIFKQAMDSDEERLLKKQIQDIILEIQKSNEDIGIEMAKSNKAVSIFRKIFFKDDEDLEGKQKRLVVKFKHTGDIIAEYDKKMRELHTGINTSNSQIDLNTEILRDTGKKLAMYIVAGRLALENATTELLPQVASEVKTSGSFEKEVELKYIQDNITILEGKLKTLGNTRMTLALALAQLFMIRTNNGELINQIDQAINQLIPIWKQMSVNALLQNKSQIANNSMKDMTTLVESMVTQISTNIKDESIELAKSSAKGVIDPKVISDSINTLKDACIQVEEITRSSSVEMANVEAETEKSLKELNELIYKLGTGTVAESKKLSTSATTVPKGVSDLKF